MLHDALAERNPDSLRLLYLAVALSPGHVPSTVLSGTVLDQVNIPSQKRPTAGLLTDYPGWGTSLVSSAGCRQHLENLKAQDLLSSSVIRRMPELILFSSTI